jgi:hypothetical protein
MPDIEHLDLGARHDAKAERRTAVIGDAIAQHPLAVRNETAVTPSAGDPVSARNGGGLAGRIQRPDQDSAAGAEAFRRCIERHGASQPAVAGRNDRAPSDRAILPGQFFDNLKKRNRRKFGTTRRQWQPHRKQPGLAERLCQFMRQLPVAVEPVGQ